MHHTVYVHHADRYDTGHTINAQTKQPADITFSACYCNLQHNQIMMDLLLAFGPNWLLHPLSDEARPQSVDISDMPGNGFQEGVGRECRPVPCIRRDSIHLNDLLVKTQWGC